MVTPPIGSREYLADLVILAEFSLVFWQPSAKLLLHLAGFSWGLALSCQWPCPRDRKKVEKILANLLIFYVTRITL